MAEASDSYQDVLVDPQAQQQLADIYSATGSRPPTLPPPQPSYGAGPISPAPAPAPGFTLPGFINDAMSGLQKFGQGASDLAGSEIGGRLGFGPLPQSATDVRNFAENIPVVGGVLGAIRSQEENTRPFGPAYEALSPEERAQRQFAAVMGLTGGVGKAGEAAGAAVPGVLKSAEQMVAEHFTPAAETVAEGPAPRDYAGNLNLNTLNAPPEVKTVLREMYEDHPDAIEEIRALGQTHGETVAKAQAQLGLAQATGMTPGEFTTAALANAQKTPEQLVASKMAIVQATNDLVSAMKDVAQAPDNDALRVRVVQLLTDQLKAQADLAGIVASSGRTLEANKIAVEASNLVPGTPGVSAAFKRATDVLYGIQGSDKFEAFKDAFTRLDPNDTAGLNKFIRDAQGVMNNVRARQAPSPDLWWYFNHNLIGALLSGTTAPAVAGSYVVRSVLDTVAQYGAAGVQALGVARGPGMVRTQTLADANAFASAMWTRGIGRGFATALNDIVSRTSSRALSEASGKVSQLDRYPTFNPAAPGSKLPQFTLADISGFGAARAADVTGSFTRLVSGIEDGYKVALSHAFLARDLAQQARAMNLVGDARDAFINEGMRNPDFATFERAGDAARFNTYQFRKAGAWTQALLNAREAAPGPLRVLFKMEMPFLNAPVNILRYAGETFPTGLIGAFGATAPGIGQAEASIRVARALMGSIGLAAIKTQMDSGNIRGFNPYRHGTTEAEAWDMEGPEISVRAGTDPATGRARWISLERVPPVSYWVKAIAAWDRAFANDKTVDPTDRMVVGLAGAAKVALDDTWFTSLSNLINIGESFGTPSQDKYIQRALQNTVAENIPLSGRLRVINHEMGVPPTDPTNFTDYLKAQIPGLAQQVPQRQGLLGPEQPQYNTGLLAELPWRMAVDRSTQISTEIERLKAAGFAVPEPINSTSGGRGTTLTADEIRNLRGYAYPLMLDAVDKTMGSSEYTMATDAQKHVLLTRAVDEAHRSAKLEYAKNELVTSQDPAQVTRGALVGMSAVTSLRDRADWVQYLEDNHRLTPEVARAIDASRPVGTPSDPNREPSVQEYLRADPYIHQYLSMRPYLIGNQEEWDQLAAAKKRESAYIRDHPAPRGINDLNWYQMANPQDGILIRRYSFSLVRNPQREMLLKQHPEVSRFLSDTQDIQD